jgi:hypothetical protein
VVEGEAARLHKLITNLLTMDYKSAEETQMILTDACSTVGHPPKVDKPYELKQDWQRGCRCGRQEFA